MRRVQGSKSVIFSKKELEIVTDLFLGVGCNYYYELPLFDLKAEPKVFYNLQTDYILVRPCKQKFTQSFFDRINKTWNKMYD